MHNKWWPSFFDARGSESCIPIHKGKWTSVCNQWDKPIMITYSPKDGRAFTLASETSLKSESRGERSYLLQRRMCSSTRLLEIGRLDYVISWRRKGLTSWFMNIGWDIINFSKRIHSAWFVWVWRHALRYLFIIAEISTGTENDESSTKADNWAHR